MKYIATFKVYMYGPDDYEMEVSEDIGSQHSTLVLLTENFLTLLSGIANFDRDQFVPYNMRIMVDEEVGDDEVT